MIRIIKKYYINFIIFSKSRRLTNCSVVRVYCTSEKAICRSTDNLEKTIASNSNLPPSDNLSPITNFTFWLRHCAIFPRSSLLSIVTAVSFHNRVRNGSMWIYYAIKRLSQKVKAILKNRSSFWSIRISQLHILLHLHLIPIKRLVLPWPSLLLCKKSTHLEVSFPLRCFQRLSSPYLATQRLPLA